MKNIPEPDDTLKICGNCGKGTALSGNMVQCFPSNNSTRATHESWKVSGEYTCEQWEEKK